MLQPGCHQEAELACLHALDPEDPIDVRDDLWDLPHEGHAELEVQLEFQQQEKKSGIVWAKLEVDLQQKSAIMIGTVDNMHSVSTQPRYSVALRRPGLVTRAAGVMGWYGTACYETGTQCVAHNSE